MVVVVVNPDGLQFNDRRIGAVAVAAQAVGLPIVDRGPRPVTRFPSTPSAHLIRTRSVSLVLGRQREKKKLVSNQSYASYQIVNTSVVTLLDFPCFSFRDRQLYSWSGCC